MIRSLTGISFVCAVVSVLYTYQSKHAADLVERDIKKTVRDTMEIREKTRLLDQEWTKRINPDQLQPYADRYLTLKTLDPKQYAKLDELDQRLPQPRALPVKTDVNSMTDETESEALPAMAVASDASDDTTTVAEELPIPPMPVPPPAPTMTATATPSIQAAVPAPQAPAVAAPAVRPAPAAVVPPPAPRPMIAMTEPRPLPRSVETRPIETRSIETRQAEIRPAPARAPLAAPVAAPGQQAAAPTPIRPPLQAQYQPAPRPVYAAAPSYSGSMLGMAQGGGSVPALAGA